MASLLRNSTEEKCILTERLTEVASLLRTLDAEAGDSKCSKMRRAQLLAITDALKAEFWQAKLYSMEPNRQYRQCLFGPFSSATSHQEFISWLNECKNKTAPGSSDIIAK